MFFKYFEEIVKRSIEDEMPAYEGDVVITPSSGRSLIWSYIQDVHYTKARPTVADAARVMNITLDDVYRVLDSDNCLQSYEDDCSESFSHLTLDEHSVKCLTEYNYKIIKKYYHKARKSLSSMSDDERWTFDNFVQTYSIGKKKSAGKRLNREKIDRDFIQDLFTAIEDGVIYGMTLEECRVLNYVRESVYYNLRDLASEVIGRYAKRVSSGIRHELQVMLRAFRYHIFTIDSDSPNFCFTTVCRLLKNHASVGSHTKQISNFIWIPDLLTLYWKYLIINV